MAVFYKSGPNYEGPCPSSAASSSGRLRNFSQTLVNVAVSELNDFLNMLWDLWKGQCRLSLHSSGLGLMSEMMPLSDKITELI